MRYGGKTHAESPEWMRRLDVLHDAAKTTSRRRRLRQRLLERVLEKAAIEWPLLGHAPARSK